MERDLSIGRIEDASRDLDRRHPLGSLRGPSARPESKTRRRPADGGEAVPGRGLSSRVARRSGGTAEHHEAGALHYISAARRTSSSNAIGSARPCSRRASPRSRRPGNGLDRLCALIRAYATVMTQDFGMCLVRLDDRELGEAHRREVRKAKRRYDEAFRSQIVMGIDDGSIRPCDPKVAAFVIAGAPQRDRQLVSAGRRSRRRDDRRRFRDRS